MNHELPGHAYEVGYVVHDGLVLSAPAHRTCQWVQSEVPRNPVCTPHAPCWKGTQTAHQAPESPPEPSAPLASGSLSKPPTESTIHPTP